MTTIYPVPAAVTEARVQLAVDQEAKAPPTTIINDVDYPMTCWVTG